MLVDIPAHVKAYILYGGYFLNDEIIIELLPTVWQYDGWFVQIKFSCIKFSFFLTLYLKLNLAMTVY